MGLFQISLVATNEIIYPLQNLCLILITITYSSTKHTEYVSLTLGFEFTYFGESHAVGYNIKKYVKLCTHSAFPFVLLLLISIDCFWVTVEKYKIH